MSTWYSDTHVDFAPITKLGWLRVVLRASVLFVLIFGGLAVLLLCRLIEYPIFRAKRPFTPFITQFVCRWALRIIRLRYVRNGHPCKTAAAIVANHSSWLDIFTLNAGQRIYFVSKSQVAQWPGIGWLARATGTLFISRDRRDAKKQADIIEHRLSAGHQLLFFPEGTSTDGSLVLPFKSTLFAPFLNDSSQERWVQAVSVRYFPDPRYDSKFFGWWGGMTFGPHFLQVLARNWAGSVHVTYHAPQNAAFFADRKALAKAAEMAVRTGFDESSVKT